jgi:pimeloyl-ACP methyl ester carboxylesterase
MDFHSADLFRSLLIQAAVLMPLTVGISAQADDSRPGKLRHGYVDMRYGQLHYSIAQPPGGKTDKTPIILLHQSPNSSVEHEPLVMELGKDRITIAPDTPGHGGSDGPDAIPTIEDYAGAIAEGLQKLGYGPNRPVDLFGFHTGSRVATELALSHPAMVRRVILGLSPYGFVDDALSKKLYDEVYHPKSATDLLERFCRALPQRIATAQKTDMPDPAWGRIAIETLRHTTRHEFGHAAAFEYGPRFKVRLLEISQPVLLFPIDDPVDAYQGGKTSLSTSREVKPLMRKAKYVDIAENDFHNNAFYRRAKDVAETFRRFLDKP